MAAEKPSTGTLFHFFFTDRFFGHACATFAPHPTRTHGRLPTHLFCTTIKLDFPYHCTPPKTKQAHWEGVGKRKEKDHGWKDEWHLEGHSHTFRAEDTSPLWHMLSAFLPALSCSYWHGKKSPAYACCLLSLPSGKEGKEKPPGADTFPFLPGSFGITLC